MLEGMWWSIEHAQQNEANPSGTTTCHGTENMRYVASKLSDSEHNSKSCKELQALLGIWRKSWKKGKGDEKETIHARGQYCASW